MSTAGSKQERHRAGSGERQARDPNRDSVSQRETLGRKALREGPSHTWERTEKFQLPEGPRGVTGVAWRDSREEGTEPPLTEQQLPVPVSRRAAGRVQSGAGRGLGAEKGWLT